MHFFRYPEDRIPISFFAGLFLIDVLVFCFVPFFPWALGYGLLALVPKVFACSWNHHHQHVATFRHLLLNRAVEFIYGLHTGITTNAWVLHHNLGHHVNYLDQKKDESGWQRPDGTVMGELEYTLKIAITGYWRAIRVGRRYPQHLGAFFGMGTFVLTFVVTMLILDWRKAAVLFVLPMAAGYLATCWHTYFHHAGLETEDPFKASHNIMHRGYNLLTGNLGYHTAHHVKPGLHWSRLPEFHETIAHRIPPELFVAPSPPFSWMGWGKEDRPHPRAARGNAG